MSSLFDNPMIKSALKTMTPEQLENFKKIGEHMYGNVNFEDSSIIENLNPPMKEALVYIEQGLNAGLHPRDLEEKEVDILVEARGDEWYKKYGYERTEVPEPGLSMKTKENLDKIIERKSKQLQKVNKNPKVRGVNNKKKHR